MVANPATPAVWLRAWLECLERQCRGACLYALGTVPSEQSEAIEKLIHAESARGAFADWHLSSNGDNATIYASLNDKILSEKGRWKYLLHIRTPSLPGNFRLDSMIGLLEGMPHVVGVNPLFINTEREKPRVVHLGTAVDSQGMLRYLYEGLAACDKLVARRRFFQLAHPGAILARVEDLANTRGMPSGYDNLDFYDLCFQLRSARKGFFCTDADSTCILNDKFDSWRNCGLWNGLTTRGKIAPDLLLPDYHSLVRADDLIYGVDEWLNEGPLNLDPDPDSRPDSSGESWLKCSRHPNPHSLLAFLGSLNEKELQTGVNLLRALPATLPRQFIFYDWLARWQMDFARHEKLAEMAKQLEEWRRNSRRFHRSKLIPGMRALKEAGIYNCSLDESPSVFEAWLELGEHFEAIEPGSTWPEIAVVMPVWNAPHAFLRQAIESVKRQTYPRWQMCIADDASTDPEIAPLLRSLCGGDPRFKIVFREQNGHICNATNSALELVTAPWVAFMDQDDLLAREALAQVARAVAANGQLGMIFSDNDHVDANNIRRNPVFKPAYDDELRFFWHLSCYRADLLRKLEGMRAGFEGSQDTDLSLRAIASLQPDQIHHIPHILYHWRVHSGSSAGSLASKPYVLEATRKALEGYAQRQGHLAKAESTARNNFFRLAYAISDSLDCSVILLDDSDQISAEMLASLKRMAHLISCEFFWQPLASNIQMPESLAKFSPGVIPLPYAGADWVKAYHNAARLAPGKILLFLYAGLFPLPDCRPEQLCARAAMADAGPVGGMLWQGDYLWHGGLYPDITGLPFPLLRGTPASLLPAWCWGQFLLSRRTIGAPWQCLAVKKDLIDESYLPGKSTSQFMETEWSLELERRGFQTIASPWGQWRLNPKQVKAAYGHEKFVERWGAKVRSHGLRNPSLRAAPDYDWTLIF